MTLKQNVYGDMVSQYLIKFAATSLIENKGTIFHLLKQVTLFENFAGMLRLSEAWYQKSRVCNSDINLLKFHSQLRKQTIPSAIQMKKSANHETKKRNSKV